MSAKFRSLKQAMEWIESLHGQFYVNISLEPWKHPGATNKGNITISIRENQGVFSKGFFAYGSGYTMLQAINSVLESWNQGIAAIHNPPASQPELSGTIVSTKDWDDYHREAARESAILAGRAWPFI